MGRASAKTESVRGAWNSELDLMGESEKISMGRKGKYEMEFYWSKEADVAGFGEGKFFSLSSTF